MFPIFFPPVAFKFSEFPLIQSANSLTDAQCVHVHKAHFLVNIHSQIGVPQNVPSTEACSAGKHPVVVARTGCSFARQRDLATTV